MCYLVRRTAFLPPETTVISAIGNCRQPAINLAASGTRKEHLLMSEKELATVTALRRRLLAMPPHVQIEQLLSALKRFPTNADMIGQSTASAS